MFSMEAVVSRVNDSGQICSHLEVASDNRTSEHSHCYCQERCMCDATPIRVSRTICTVCAVVGNPHLASDLLADEDRSCTQRYEEHLLA